MENSDTRIPYLVEELRNEILTGDFLGREFLPSTHILRKNYHCSFYTIMQAIQILQKDGYLKPVGKKFRLPTGKNPAKIHSRPLILLNNKTLFDSNMARIIHGMELQEAKSGGEILIQNQLNERFNSWHKVSSIVQFKGREIVSHKKIPKNIPNVFIELNPPAKPFSPQSNQYVIYPDHIWAGTNVASYLYLMGYRKICFLTHVPCDTNFVSNRLAGIQGYFKKHKDVEVLVNDFSLQLQKRYDRTAGGQFRKPLHSTEQPWYKLQMEYLPHYMLDELIVQPTWQLAHFSAIASVAKKLLPSIMESPQPPEVFVCVNDVLGIICKHILEKSQYKIPEDVSLFGFDNLPWSRLSDLTTYDPQYELIGSKAMSCITLLSAQLSRSRIYPVRGNIVIRSTTTKNLRQEGN